MNIPPTYAYDTATIMDPVHGAIDVHLNELAILDHPLMQRLRRLKQNDVVHYVFPGATHTRFAHSIGVMHIAGRCLESIIAATVAYRIKGAARHVPIPHQYSQIANYLIRLLRTAALLHDCGHGPFSHEFEKSSAFQDLIKHNHIIDVLWDESSLSKYFNEKPTKLSHEHLSICAAAEILQDALSATAKQAFDETAQQVLAEDVLAIMDGTYIAPSSHFASSAKSLLSLFGVNVEDAAAAEYLRTALRSILCGTLNADAMDYMLRDSYYTGCKYGVYNLDHLVSSLRLGFTLTTQKEPSWIGLAVTDKGVGALDDFAFSRLQLYREVYSHRAVVGIKILLSHSIAEVLVDKHKSRIIASQISDMSQFALLHDDSMMGHFQDVAMVDGDSACYDLIHRRKLGFLDRLEKPQKSRISQMRKELQAECHNDRVLDKESNIRGDPTAVDGDQIRVLRYRRGKPAELVELQSAQSSHTLGLTYKIVDFFQADRGWARSAHTDQGGKKGIMICGVGLPCSGKSSVMRYLAARLGGKYYREPEEVKWPEAVLDRNRVGKITALTWFRAIRVPHLYSADSQRKAGGVGVVDSCYDKLIHHYLEKEHTRWLIDSADPYFASYKQIAELDMKLLPTPDVIIVFKITFDEWKALLRKRGRILDKDEAFLKSFESQAYFEDAARSLAKTTDCLVHVFTQDLKRFTTAEQAGEQLFSDISGLVNRRRGDESSESTGFV